MCETTPPSGVGSSPDVQASQRPSGDHAGGAEQWAAVGEGAGLAPSVDEKVDAAVLEAADAIELVQQGVGDDGRVRLWIAGDRRERDDIASGRPLVGEDRGRCLQQRGALAPGQRQHSYLVTTAVRALANERQPAVRRPAWRAVVRTVGEGRGRASG